MGMKMSVNESELGDLVVMETFGGRCNWGDLGWAFSLEVVLGVGSVVEACAKEGDRVFAELPGRLTRVRVEMALVSGDEEPRGEKPRAGESPGAPGGARAQGGEGGRRERDGGRSAGSAGVSWPGSLLPQSVARRAPLQEPGRESWTELGWREALRREDAPAQGAGLNRHAARRPGLVLSTRMRFEIATRRERRKGEKGAHAWLFLGMENVSGIRINKISSQRELNCLRKAWK